MSKIIAKSEIVLYNTLDLDFFERCEERMAKLIGIDLGTSSVLIFIRGKGIVLEEPSVAAIDSKTGELTEVGKEALLMLGRTPSEIEVVRPMRDGVISKYEITLSMLRRFIKNAIGKNQIFKPFFSVCVPSGITDVEERAVRDAITQLGARMIYIIEEPMAAAVGAGLDVTSPDAKLIIDIGGGTTDIAVISSGKIAFSESLRVAGDKFDEAITRYVRKKYNVLIGERTAEKIKNELGSVWQREEPISLEVKGRDLIEGLPKCIRLNSSEMVGALEEPITLIVEALCNVLEKVPPELLGDITKNGIVMTGGGSMLFGIDKLIANVVGIKTRVAENAISCVAIGTEKALEKHLEDPEKFPEFSKNKKQFELNL